MKRLGKIVIVLCLVVGMTLPGGYYAITSSEPTKTSISQSVARGGSGDLCYEHVKNIKQTKTYNCGPTTILQTLYGMDSQGQVEGNTDAEKIAALEECGTNSENGTYVYEMVNALNKYNIYGRVYQAKAGSSFDSEYAFKNCIATSLTCCKPVILHARTGELTYYGGKDLRHYLSLDVYDRRTETVRIVDCNYDDAYYGIHEVPVSEAYDCIKISGRYLIY